MKKILFVANVNKDKNLLLSKEVVQTLSKKACELYVDVEDLVLDNVKLVSKEILKQIDLMVVLGGDGTILTYTRKYEKYALPIMGINIGRVGALAVAEFDNYEFYFDEYLKGDFVNVNHLALDGEIIYANGKTKKFTAYNDIFSHRGMSPKLLKTNIAVNNSDFSEVYADGIIVSTPVGSSAYNLSAGGPLLSTSSNCYVITPICPQSKTFTSLVVSKDDEIHLTVGENMNVSKNQNVVIVDGFVKFAINANDIVHIKQSKKSLKMVQFTPQKSLYESVYKTVVSINKKGEK